MNHVRFVSRRPAVAAAAAILAPALAAAAEAPAQVTFVDHALPVLRQRCGSCHNADKKTAGLDVTTYAGIMAGGGSGEVIAAGDAAQSHLYRVVTHQDEPKMPPDGTPIPEAERAVLATWINGGVLENSGSRPVVAKKVDVAMTAPADKRPDVVPLPAHLPLEPVVRTATLDACASIATSPWAPLAAVCGQKQVLLYDTRSLELAGVLPFPEGRPHVVRFSRGGGLVLAGGGVGAASGRVALWNLRNGRRIRTLGAELDVVLAADISADQRLVVLGGPQKVARIHAVATGEKLHDLRRHTDWVLAASFSPDGTLLATADRAGGVFVWEAATGRDFLTIPVHPAAVTCLSWRDDSNLLATGCDDGQIRLFEPENGSQVKAWAAHGGGVTALEFTRDARIASIGRDKTPKLWKPDGSQERAFEASADVGLAASFCDETGRLVVGDWTGEIRVWNGADGARVGGLDPNPARLAERVAAAGKALAERTAQLDAAVLAVAAAEAAIASVPQKQAAEAARQTTDIDAALVAAQAALAERVAAVVTLRGQVAADAEAQARWLREAAFQASFEQLSADLARREQSLGGAEAEAADAEAKRQAGEQARVAAVAERDGMQKQIDGVNAAVAANEAKAKDLAAQLEKRGSELAATQAAIEKTLQAIAVLDEAARCLEKGLAAASDDADLERSFAALGGARQAKQGQLEQQQDALATMMTEKGQWDQALAAERAAIEKQRADVAALAKGLEAAAAKIEAATAAVAAATKVVEEKRAVVTTREGEVEAASRQLDVLQGIGG